MTITLTQKENWELWAEAEMNSLQNPEPDEFICQVPRLLGKGYARNIHGYNVPNASIATKTDTPLRDIPQSIQVVPQEVLRDRNVRTFYVGDRQGDLDNSLILPSYLRTDAAIYYRRNGFNAAINIRNLFDKTYYEYSYGRLYNQLGNPFTILGSVSWEF
ncbi:MAG: hypothetical protein V7L20_31320 [Nostoc sp.]|uniref:hypothetical protein n=1 Tax=Nostoc sp. TaxID=1180 RepID=UPI002FF88E92